MTGEIENLIDELPQASKQRVEEIATILEGVLSDRDCNFPSENDAESAYECQDIPKAQEIIGLIRAWNVRDREKDDRESEIKMINKLSRELKTAFNQI